MFRQISLNQIPRFIRAEPEHHVDFIDVTRVQTDRVSRFRRDVAELEEVVRHLGWAGHLACTVEAKHEEVED